MSPTNGTTNGHAAAHHGFGTLAVHSGQEHDPITRAVIPPISLSTTFSQSAAGVHSGYDYSRSGNPTRANFETAIAALEKARFGLAFASGSATTATLVHLVKAGGHVVVVNDTYGGTFRYFTKVAEPVNGVEVTFVDLRNAENLKGALKENTQMVWIETPTNPTLRLIDISAVATIAHAHPLRPLLVVDNTFLSPYFQNPLLHGADVVVHSVTKYLNGHSDVIMGVAATNDEAIYSRLKFLQNSIGAIPSPMDCYLAQRGLKTLHLRMRQHQTNALAVATLLSHRTDLVAEVIYPGLPSHPQHDLALKQQSGFGGMVSFRFASRNLEQSNAFLGALKLFALAESLGGVESLAELPAVMTHASLTEEARRELGVDAGLVRLSCGVEETEDLVEDIKKALEVAAKVK
ncbi:Cys/Met metabolism PLP-dependent enzyme-domain-containing protein [Cladochytrium replicatum]|nr:Cys/Met metabolism PLP-dependent enzyme-domain-containing protein [Cladochytrium replicatum]